MESSANSSGTVLPAPLFWVDPVNELTVVLFVQIFPFSNEVHKKFRDAVYGPFAVP